MNKLREATFRSGQEMLVALVPGYSPSESSRSVEPVRTLSKEGGAAIAQQLVEELEREILRVRPVVSVRVKQKTGEQARKKK